ncbi:hypothetical protein GCM10009127_04240 [Alteraurantiacibacter aestuarii]|uniref:Uncharacterized protein n=1 Tax=Alteraurantiacibacter aestuarii TaxID=650004 RepID=A0A844ZKJ5_9SPHN|nr:hypothetical protein [Alteraurantiacibacter aestuarii]MXO88325.1 hypothetical protein [Alteraurantiacibacter aestuarii]
MSKRPNRFATHYGYGEIKTSRYLVLYVAQAFWLVFGVYLYSGAFWPSTCTPENVLEIYSCSMRLPENGGWREAALLTWLWATPILILLEISRRMGKSDD